MLKNRNLMIFLAVVFAACFASYGARASIPAADETAAALQLLYATAENIVQSRTGAVAALEYENIVDQLDLSAGGLEKSPKLREAMQAATRAIKECANSDAYAKMKREHEQARTKKLFDVLAAQNAAAGKEWQEVAAELAKSVSCYLDTAMGLAAGNALADLSEGDIQKLRTAQNALCDETYRFWTEVTANENSFITRGALVYIRQALKEPDAARRAAMLELLDADSAAFPLLLFYAGQAALNAGDRATAKAYFVRFREVWHSPLKRDPYLAQTAKYEYLLADNLTSDKMKELAQQTLTNSNSGDWCDRLFAATLLYSAGEKDEAVKIAQANELNKAGAELNKVFLQALRTDTTVSHELRRIACERKAAEDARKAAEARKAEEAQKAEEARKAAEALQAEEKRITEEARKKALEQKLVVGGTVKFGRYYKVVFDGTFTGDRRGVVAGHYYKMDRSGTYEKGPLEWLVLAEENGRYLLISKYIIDYKPFDERGLTSRWEISSLRRWLANEFLNAAFTADERRQIVTTTNTNDDDHYYDTRDKVFILDWHEARHYFSEDSDRKCVLSFYSENASKVALFDWWLRGPYRQEHRISYVAYIDEDGDTHPTFGIDVNHFLGVRPAIWVKPPLIFDPQDTK